MWSASLRAMGRSWRWIWRTGEEDWRGACHVGTGPPAVAGGHGDGRGTPAPLEAATGHLRLRHSSGASGARVGPSSHCACAGGGGGGIMGAMVSRWVGRGGGKPEWDWGCGREGTQLQGGLGFSFSGPGTGAWFVSSRDQPFPLWGLLETDFVLPFHLLPSLLDQMVTAHLSQGWELWRDRPTPRLLFFRFAMCYSFLGRETGLNSLGMVSKVSTCGSESLHRSLYKGKLKVLASYLLRLRTVSMLGFPFLSLPGNCSEVVEFVGE